MNFHVVMSDHTKDERIELDIVASSVFDAIDEAACQIKNPSDTELIEAYPLS